MPTVAFKAENIVPDGWDQDEFDYTPFTYAFNMTCHPAATINCGFSDGLPIGFQIIAKKDYDVENEKWTSNEPYMGKILFYPKYGTSNYEPQEYKI